MLKEKGKDALAVAFVTVVVLGLITLGIGTFLWWILVEGTKWIRGYFPNYTPHVPDWLAKLLGL